MEAKKLKSIMDDFKNAVQRLSEALKEKKTELNIDGTIQRFEFTFELSWKLMKAVADYQGKDEKANNPRDAIRYAALVGLISDPETWLKFLKERNSTTHLYSKQASRDSYEQIKKFPRLCNELRQNIEQFVIGGSAAV